MSEVKRFDHVNHAHVDDCAHIENPGGAWVKASDYDALAAEAQALREEVAQQKFLTKVENDALKMMTDKANELKSEVEQLEEELESLRARVVVAPERKLLNAGVPGLNRNSGWNACLDELARLNGKTVSEGLLRLTLEFIMATNYKGSIPLGLIEELRALLNQDKENGNG
ncbi:TPA: hypothetical protein ACGW39_001747 [Pseudomonas aeruginosa]|uniref:hypothetical protein n=1 Tax=Pseudomonas aeruginosa TaxID=287 RepID=UPI0017E2FD46|nr:hypothetical protein [Pseudomonas aeruginosa]MDG3887240.1 hypothetical protein [Pseudomonas aeruginosa]MDU0693818.1 hypothetical protein [Pseudomonas aeruginosa]HEJ5787362.1 hypothetical protein [Pseudomonas aeruginosa]